MEDETEHLLNEVRDASKRLGMKPSLLVEKANCGNGTTWRKWEDREGSPKLTTVTKLRAWIRDQLETSEDA